MIPKNAKIYVAGHSGMVGSSIMRKLTADGYTNLITKKFEELNLLDQAAVTAFFEHELPEYVILTAARVGGIKANMTYPSEFLYENLQIQNNVIWQAHTSGVKKLLFLGSSCIYPRTSPQPMKEDYFMDGKVEPTNEGYAIAKIAGLKMCEYIYAQHNQAFISCMPTNIYGVNDHFDSESGHVIPALMQRMHQAKLNNTPEVVIWGTGNTRREFLFVDDLADCCAWLLNNYKEKQFLNVGTGIDISIKELAALLKGIIGYEGQLIYDTTKPDGFPKKLLDVSKMTKAGWKAKTKLEDGLKITYEWFLEHKA